MFASRAGIPGSLDLKNLMSVKGDVPNVVFPCGLTIGNDGDTIYLYYGAADTCIGVATGSIRSSALARREWDALNAPDAS